MNNITNESITLYEIWRVFNDTNKEGEYLLSINDEEKIHKILKEYAEAINIVNIDEEIRLSTQDNTKPSVYNFFIKGLILGASVVGFILVIILIFN